MLERAASKVAHFIAFDHSGLGDGRLDHLELKLAIRLTSGDEVPLTDCERIVRALDTDGKRNE